MTTTATVKAPKAPKAKKAMLVLTREQVKHRSIFDFTPDTEGIGLALKLMEGRYVEFSYVQQLPTPMTPSAIAERARTVIAAENNDTVKGFLVEGSFFRAKTTDHPCIRLRSICRRDAETGEYKYRTFRICGIKPETVKCLDGRNGKRACFPCGVGQPDVR